MFLDEGPPIERLLVRLQEREQRQGPAPYLDRVLAAFPQVEHGGDLLRGHTEQEKAQSLLDPLSPRELEVLRELARGASNQEIAKALVLAIDTVKRHVSNILSKLEVSNRT